MAIYNNETDPNVKDWNKWQQDQIELQINEPRRRFEQLAEQNKEHILAEDQLNCEYSGLPSVKSYNIKS
jgi:hypothetical protein